MAFAVDVVAVVLIFALAGQALDYVVSTIFDTDFSLTTTTVLSDVLLALWAFALLRLPALDRGADARAWGSSASRSSGADGRALDNRHAILRVLALLLSIVFFWLAVILVLSGATVGPSTT